MGRMGRSLWFALLYIVTNSLPYSVCINNKMSEELSDLDILYLPSRWSKRLSADVIVEKHLEFVTKESERIVKSIPNKLGIPYGTREKEKIDIFGTDLKDGAPIFIFIHGGYWQEQSITRNAYWFLAENLYRNNVKSIFIGYELCPNVTMLQIVEEINAALAKSMEYAKECNTRDIYLAGHSAGAHLAATIFTENFCQITTKYQDLIKAAFLISGVYDLIPLLQTHINDPLKLDAATAKKLSPEFQKIDDNKIKFYVIAAEHDSPAFVEQAEKFHKKLKEDNINSNFEVFNGYDHFDIIECMKEESFRLNKLIVAEINKNKGV